MVSGHQAQQLALRASVAFTERVGMVEQAEEDARGAAEDTLIFHRGAAQTTYLQVLFNLLEVRLDLGLFQEKRVAFVDVDLTDISSPWVDVAEYVAMDRLGVR